MEKTQREEINRRVLFAWRIAWRIASRELREVPYNDNCIGKRLRHCTAWVYETDEYYFLRSYNVIVAFIDKSTDTLYDILRFGHFYKPVCTQHIAKFERDYGRGECGCESSLTYCPV